MTRWSEAGVMREKRVTERRSRCSPIAQVLTWPAWQGSARAANQARPGEDFTGAATAAQGATPPGLLRLAPAQPPTESQQHSHTMTTTKRRSWHQELAGEVPIAAATESRFPEQDLASDLLGAGAVDKLAWWRRVRKMRGYFTLGGSGEARRNQPRSPGRGAGG
jgi:hypothetical protein